MLVCNVSQLARRAAIAADVAEAAVAVDALGTGNIVFATLVDDPASVGEIVDAFLGEIMVEAASASDSFDVGFAYDAAATEAATGTDSPDATITPAATATTWSPTDKTANITVSGGNLTATANAGGNGGVRCTAGRSGVKVYFEILYNAVAGGGTTFSGIALASASLPTFAGNGAGGIGMFDSGAVFRNGSGTGVNIGSIAAGKRHCIAVDMVAKLFWARVDAGNWNGSSSNNPATGVGGIDISAVFTTTLDAFAAYGTASGSNNCTVNFGATAFAQTVPSGFAAWV